jgi:hypothetical protein
MYAKQHVFEEIPQNNKQIYSRTGEINIPKKTIIQISNRKISY